VNQWPAESFRIAAVLATLMAGCATPPVIEPPVPLPRAVFEFALPESPSQLHISVSPDGQQIVGWAESGNGLALWSRRLTDPAVQNLPGSERPRSTSTGFPFWSPDSQSIALFGNNALQVIDRSGGQMRTLASAPFGHGGSWGRAGVIVYAPDSKGPLYRVYSDGGKPEPATRLDPGRGETAHLHPWFLPDGRHFLYLAQSRNAENDGIWVGSLDSNERIFLLGTTMKAVFIAPGTLLYVDGRTLMARPFDAERLMFAGPARVVLGPVGNNPRNGAAGFTASDNGVLVYLPGLETSHPRKGPVRVMLNWDQAQDH
jgi:eukaryotic-like serine/threonine-protein kinase